MDYAFLASLLLNIALGVYALRVAAARDRLGREVDIWRDSASGFTIVYGPDFSQESARQRQERAKQVLAKAKRRK